MRKLAIAWLGVLWVLMLPLSRSAAQTCQAEFSFAFVDEEQVVLFNTSDNYTGQSWNLGGHALTYQDGPVASFGFVGDTTWVCLEVWDASGCSDQLCQAVYAGAPGELCEITDCIWPGDANGDGKANQYDLLHLGMAYGATGPQRTMFPIPLNPIAWAPNFAENWQAGPSAVNAKHADTNGDGAVNASDINAIPLNYAPEWAFLNNAVPGHPPVFIELETPVITITDHSPSTFLITAKLMMGEAAFPFDDAYGIALDILYPQDLVVPSGAIIEYDEASLLGAPGQVLTLMQDLSLNNLGRQDWAASRVNGIGVDGHGPVASLTYVVSSDIIGGRTEPEVPFNIIVERVRVLNRNGTELIINLPNGGVATAIIINDTVARGNGTNEPSLSVFPNPAGHWLYAEWQGLHASRIELINLLGQPVLNQAIDGTQAQIAVSSLEAGLYWVLLHAEEGTAVQRVQIR